MVSIRLSRGGAKKRPFYHIVVTDSRKARDSGACIERLGYFNPVARGAEVRLYIDIERVNAWLAKGAQPSERVASLIKEFRKAQAAA
ncbi:MAG: 30S ribosomal protein S16 [Halothiobacillaceae bacterium]